MKQVAKEEFKSIGKILEKAEKGTLTKAEENYRKAYLARCKELCPDMYKRTGSTYSKLLKEYEAKNN